MNLTSRQWKGLQWEIVVVNTFLRLCFNNHELQHNPFDPLKWVSNMASGVDIKVPSRKLMIECKFVQAPVGLTYIMRDWLPRFDGCESMERIVVCNCPELVSFPARMCLKVHGIKLVSLKTFVNDYHRTVGVTDVVYAPSAYTNVQCGSSIQEYHRIRGVTSTSDISNGVYCPSMGYGVKCGVGKYPKAWDLTGKPILLDLWMSGNTIEYLNDT